MHKGTYFSFCAILILSSGLCVFGQVFSRKGAKAQRKTSGCRRAFLCAFAPLREKTSLSSQRVQQPPEVVEAYQVCERFQKLLAENFDFNRAFEETFTKNESRRREIAIAEGEFGDLNFTRIDTPTLIDAFKSRMQIFYDFLVLVSAEDAENKTLYFPHKIGLIMDRKPPKRAQQFASYVKQLKQDATLLRAHVEQLAKDHAPFGDHYRKYKEDLTKKIEPPNRVVEPETGYRRSRVLGPNEPYYQIDSYSVIRENGEMKIVGIRFLLRLF